jgi:hypothetical protein
MLGGWSFGEELEKWKIGRGTMTTATVRVNEA